MIMTMPQHFDRYSFLVVERDLVVVVAGVAVGAAEVAGVVEGAAAVGLEYQHSYHIQHLIVLLSKKSIKTYFNNKYFLFHYYYFLRTPSR